MLPITWPRNADVCVSLLISLNLNTDYIFRILIAFNTWYIGNSLHATQIPTKSWQDRYLQHSFSYTQQYSGMVMECGFRVSSPPSTLPPQALLSQYHHLHYYLILSFPLTNPLVRFSSFGIPHFSIPLHSPRLPVARTVQIRRKEYPKKRTPLNRYI